jgi:hypothetical protein
MKDLHLKNEIEKKVRITDNQEIKNNLVANLINEDINEDYSKFLEELKKRLKNL